MYTYLQKNPHIHTYTHTCISSTGGGFCTTEPPGKSHTHTHTHTHLKGRLTVYCVFALKISFNPQRFLGWLLLFFFPIRKSRSRMIKDGFNMSLIGCGLANLKTVFVYIHI